jgi:hypothetical protein
VRPSAYSYREIHEHENYQALHSLHDHFKRVLCMLHFLIFADHIVYLLMIVVNQRQDNINIKREESSFFEALFSLRDNKLRTRVMKNKSSLLYNITM